MIYAIGAVGEQALQREASTLNRIRYNRIENCWDRKDTKIRKRSEKYQAHRHSNVDKLISPISISEQLQRYMEWNQINML